MDKVKALQKLLNGKATKKEIEMLKQALASGEISIGGDVNRSVVIIGSGNKVELTAEALGILKPETKSEEPAEGEPPYMGLRYFDTTDANLFYGRDTLTRELVGRLEKESFLAIVGASGSGKSSIVRAGIVPAWKAGIDEAGKGSSGSVHVLTPTAHPLESLAASLTRESESVTATSMLMDDMKKDTRSLRLYVRKAMSSLGDTSMLLIVDQFEEAFTLCKDPVERKSFIENLLSLAEEDGTARVVLTIRADFYHYCFEHEGLRLALEKHQANVGAMNSEELREAIVQPAEKNGWAFEPALVDLILRDVGMEPGALPLLSHALLETWKRRQGRMLTLAGYADAGGVKKAITQTAERIYDHLTPAEQFIARGIFLRLTELGDGEQDTRRRVKMDELARIVDNPDTISKVLKTLTDARLVTTEHDGVDVAHEALIREWKTLRNWLDEDRENLRLHRHLTERSQEWEHRRRDPSELYSAARLNRIQGWVKENKHQLSPLESEFLKASQNTRTRRRLQWGVIAFVGIMLLVTISLAMTGKLNRLIYQPVDMEDYWVTISTGEFQMGSENGRDSEKPIHTVSVEAFEIARYEVTNRQYIQCVLAGVCGAPTNLTYDIQKNELYPVTDINWYDARTFCEWLDGRLPTEAEWEKAAHAGMKRRANHNTVGIIWEWVNSSFDPYPYDAGDGRESSTLSDDRVLRGGLWADGSGSGQNTNRLGITPGTAIDSIGFRCARDIP